MAATDTASADSDPSSGPNRRLIAVFGSGMPMAESDELYAEALDLGRLLAEAGYLVVTGGYDGTMAAVSRGSNEAGGTVIGVTMSLFDPELPNPWLTRERRVAGFPERLRELCENPDGYVVLRGGVGTLTELGYVWGLLLTRSVPPRPLVAIGEAWAELMSLLREKSFRVSEDHLRLVRLVRTPEEAVSVLNEELRPSS